MTRYTFTLMPATFQLTWVLAKGTYLARRGEEEGAVSLYYLPDEGRGFFVEVGYDAGQQGALVVRSFPSNGPLEEYAQQVRLPAE